MKERKIRVLKEYNDKIDSSKDKKGFYPLTDDIYNITKNNKV